SVTLPLPLTAMTALSFRTNVFPNCCRNTAIGSQCGGMRKTFLHRLHLTALPAYLLRTRPVCSQDGQVIVICDMRTTASQVSKISRCSAVLRHGLFYSPPLDWQPQDRERTMVSGSGCRCHRQNPGNSHAKECLTVPAMQVTCASLSGGGSRLDDEKPAWFNFGLFRVSTLVAAMLKFAENLRQVENLPPQGLIPGFEPCRKT